mgnify:CR=1 FL=1
MRCMATELPGVLLLEPGHFKDVRRYFMETWRKESYADLGLRRGGLVPGASRLRIFS